MLIMLLMERDKLGVQILLSNTMWSAKAAYRRQTAIIKASKCLYSLVQEVISKHNIFLRYLQAVSIFIEATQPKAVCDIEHPLLSLTQRGREQKSVEFALSTSFFVLLSLHATESYRCFQIRRGNLLWGNLLMDIPPQWATADAEIKVPYVENSEFKGSPFKAWSRSVYNLACYGYCQGFLPC